MTDSPEKYKPILSIAMLSGSCSVKYDTMLSLIMTIQNLIANGVQYEFISVAGVTGVDNARNILTDIFMRGNGTHMLIIDDDMAWAADLPLRLLKENLPVLGVPYRKKRTDNKWTVNHDPVDVEFMEGRLHLMKVNSIGTGMLMVHRDVFASLRDKSDAAILGADQPAIPLYFRHTIDSNGVMKSEDFSFCEKARAFGIDVWAWVDEEIAHIGDYAYTGRYSEIIGYPDTYAGEREQLRMILR